MSSVNRESGSELEFEFEFQLLPLFTKFTKIRSGGWSGSPGNKRIENLSASRAAGQLITQKGLASRIDQMWYLEPKWLRCLKALDPEDLILSQPAMSPGRPDPVRTGTLTSVWYRGC